jgi:hypothetical protein
MNPNMVGQPSLFAILPTTYPKSLLTNIYIHGLNKINKRMVVYRVNLHLSNDVNCLAQAHTGFAKVFIYIYIYRYTHKIIAPHFLDRRIFQNVTVPLFKIFKIFKGINTYNTTDAKSPPKNNPAMICSTV